VLSDILFSSLIVLFIIFGLTRPHVALCCVIWVDTLKPQSLSFSFLAGKPLSLIVTLAFFISLFINVKKISRPKTFLPSALILVFMGWVTLTTYYAEFPIYAWVKYDYVIKTLVFSFFIPFVINSRVKLEFFIIVMVSAITFYILIGGIRTALGGGGYGYGLVQTSEVNSGISETSTLSMVGVFYLSFIIYLYRYSLFTPRIYLSKALLSFLSISSVLTVIGTYARTGLVGLLTLFMLYVVKSKYKIKAFLFVLTVAALGYFFAPPAWLDRMNTIQNANQEGSALGRIVVWRWTIDYSMENPVLGGGFDSYLANGGVLHHYVGEDDGEFGYREKAKAFHNIFFEVLGEQGYVGLAIFSLIIISCWHMNKRTMKSDSENDWKTAMSITINNALIIYCTCGMFIGVAYSPWLYYFYGLTTSLYGISHVSKPKELKR
jgi:probable O-glycosylation ligase (exosortase A-associated)